jgi:hypothetical protein
MSLQDIKTEIKFGASVAVSKENIILSKGDLLERQEDRLAHELGVKICREKGWYHHDQDDMVLSDISLYVFTPNELSLYLDAKLKAQLRRTTETETHLTDDQRKLLMLQSERI